MHRSSRVSLLAIVLLAACSDQVVSPEPAPSPSAAHLECTADVRSPTLSCRGPAAPSTGAARGAIVGGQGTYVRLASSNAAFDPSTRIFSADVTVQNLMEGAILGSYDGTGVAGIKVVFHQAPAATSGDGQVTVDNGDGTDAFTSAEQAFISFAVKLGTGEVSPARHWRFRVDPGVQTFSFKVYLEAPVFRTPPPPDNTAFVRMTAGFSHSCGLLADGRIFCWGDGGSGRLGYGGTNLFQDPVRVTGGLTWRHVSAGMDHTCGVTTTNEPFCWGDNLSGQVGAPPQVESGGFVPARYNLDPSRVSGGFTVDSLDAGGNSTCALSAGTAYCWGSNEYGQLGVGDRASRTAPAALAASPTFVDVAVGRNHACGLTGAGQAWCWGLNDYDQLGATTAENCTTTAAHVCSTTPVAVDTDLRFSAIDAGAGFTCALTSTAVAYCWGNNALGQVGSGSGQDWHPRPVAVATDLRFAQIVAMDRAACGIRANGAATCWGQNGASVTDSASDMVAGHLWRSIGGDHQHLCGATLEGVGYCAGREHFGELGSLDHHQNVYPTPVALAPLHSTDQSPRAGFEAANDGSMMVTFHTSFDRYHRNFATYSDDDFGVVKLLWSFGDGATAEGNWINHSYAANGTYTATLTVVDSAGQRAMKSQTVTINKYTPP